VDYARKEGTRKEGGRGGLIHFNPLAEKGRMRVKGREGSEYNYIHICLHPF
jgi:hypothetical protein